MQSLAGPMDQARAVARLRVRPRVRAVARVRVRPRVRAMYSEPYTADEALILTPNLFITRKTTLALNITRALTLSLTLTLTLIKLHPQPWL